MADDDTLLDRANELRRPLTADDQAPTMERLCEVFEAFVLVLDGGTILIKPRLRPAMIETRFNPSRRRHDRRDGSMPRRKGPTLVA